MTPHQKSWEVTMAGYVVQFTYMTGIQPDIFTSARLKGNWDSRGMGSESWSTIAMEKIRGSDGCPAFTAAIELFGGVGDVFEWGVELQRHGSEWQWGIPTELSQHTSDRRVRTLRLTAPDAGPQLETYYLSQARRLGAQRFYANPSNPAEPPAIQFAVWAPNAQEVDVCIGTLWETGKNPDDDPLIDPMRLSLAGRALRSVDRHTIHGGYIADGSEAGSHKSWGPFKMIRQSDGVWITAASDPQLSTFPIFDHVPYMYRVRKDSGKVVFRTDIYSRCQIGSGGFAPIGEYLGRTEELDGTVSCSIVVDPDLVAKEWLEPLWPEIQWLSQDQFFESPASAENIQEVQLKDLVIYELHIGALGARTSGDGHPGTLGDALGLLDYLQDLGINAIELLPLSEFSGEGSGWGYATSHHFALEYSGGGRDQYKHFVRECHKRGIVVILDVVYNHFAHEAERAEWMYDTDFHEKNPYYWYEGHPGDYVEFNASVKEHRRGTGGYVDNLSTAWAPRYSEEAVRSMFISSALSQAVEFKIDGFRVDQTTSIREYNKRHADGRPLGHVNAFGSKLLRELTRALRLVKPQIMLMAEDHSNWESVARDPDTGGLGFDAAWYADFYHHLVGDTDKGSDYAKLIKTAGLGDDRPLAMNFFAGALQATSGAKKVVYHESHDEAGNGKLTKRTINIAVNGAPLVGETRRVAEARCRFAAGMALLSAGIPMFLFGEEVGAEKDFLYGKVLENREDLLALRVSPGKYLFEFYRQLIRLRKSFAGLKSENIDVVFSHNDHRLIVFRRWALGGADEFLVFASLNNLHFNAPSYLFHADRIPGGLWREEFNSDSAYYGGDNVGNYGSVIANSAGAFECVVPARGFVVFRRVE